MFFKKKVNKKEQSILEKIDKDKLPKHIGIIMDGNGRWAKERNLPRTMGHRAGVETLKVIVRKASDIGIKYLTLYAFSTENWKRPAEEVNALMSLLVEYLGRELGELHKNNVIVNSIGDISKLPLPCQKILYESKEKTKNNTGLTLNLALNYGSRDEIIKAVKEISSEVKSGNISIDDIDEKTIENHLYTKGMPDPDLIIRPSGELRISNFLLWQMAYSELYFSNIYWPDFKPEDLYKAIYDYQNRDRRFGSVN